MRGSPLFCAPGQGGIGAVVTLQTVTRSSGCFNRCTSRLLGPPPLETQGFPKRRHSGSPVLRT